MSGSNCSVEVSMHAVVDNLSRWVLERARKRKKKTKELPVRLVPLRSAINCGSWYIALMYQEKITVLYCLLSERRYSWAV